MDILHVLVDARPIMLFLVLVGKIVFARSDEPVHDSPFGDWGAVDARTGGDRDRGFSEDWMMQ